MIILMLAVLAAVAFLLILIHATIGSVDLLALGLLLLALHLVFPYAPWRR